MACFPDRCAMIGVEIRLKFMRSALQAFFHLLLTRRYAL